MRTIYNKISNIINNIIDSVFHSKYNPIATKNMVNSFIKDIAKNKYFIKALRDTQSHIIDDIKAIQLTIKSMREDYESLRTFHNNLSSEYVNNSASKVELNNLKNELNARIDKVELYSEIKKSLLDTPFKDDNDNNDIKIASLERVNKQYERLLTSDNNYILEEIAKLLVPYEKEDNLQFYKISDIVDDINDRFNEFNNIYNNACDDVDNINLTNERG